MKIHRLPPWFPVGGITLPCGSVWVKWPYMVDHELIHVEQIRKLGCWRFYWRWLTDREQRARLEAEAYARDVKAGLTDRETAAGFLTGSATWWACRDLAQAYDLLREFGGIPPA